MNRSKSLSLAIIIALSLFTNTPVQAMSYPLNAMNSLIEGIRKHPVLVTTAVATVAAYHGIKAWHKSSLYWNWKSIDTSKVGETAIETLFQNRAQSLAQKNDNHKQWLWGAATSAHQVEGGTDNNNWAEWVKEPAQRDRGYVEAGIACDSWNRYEEDIQKLKETGCNAYRFSIEWSRVMPTADTFDEAALDRYADMCRTCKANGIQPVITLFHYTEPNWFVEKGSWERKENIEHFVKFCAKVFDRLYDDVYLWLTFNSPEGHALQGWQQGSKPPAKKDMQLAVTVLNNLLNAHVQVYQKLKSMPGGKESRVGMLKNIFQLDPYNACNPLDLLFCKIGNYLQSGCVFNFFKTGNFYVNIPKKAYINETNASIARGEKCLDFIGLNYYCHGYMRNGKTWRDESEIATESPNYTIYGEGLYRAIKELSENIAQPCGVPIYVTENSVAPINDDEATRVLFDKRYMHALGRAIQDGHDVRGYVRWGLIDNYEWGSYKPKYGLYRVDFDNPELPRTLKPGAQYYVDLVTASSAGQPLPAHWQRTLANAAGLEQQRVPALAAV